MNTLVELQDVARTHGSGSASVVAVHGVSCRLESGDQVAVTGASGSGKTTLLHLIAGLDRPTTGSIRWPALGGHPLSEPGQVGLVFQGPSLLPPLDAADNVALPLLLAGEAPRPAREKALEALASVGVGDLAGRLPEELSGGQAQRVAVARVLAASPRLIVADEPTGQLDSPHALTVIDLLVDAATDLGATLVVATHDPRIAGRLPRRWAMHDGTLREDETCSP
ncbi:ABC transporter ATP-binding protein [Actinomadura alba]|uniref:ABC transporter ATP-binding protein n=1 Tax=Actinomadura alba TaxID=406431 RepID=A0ABR7LRJ4_9ACTN|nr:ABC transporter ATP-binding protein [Actinomadura alba]MBC6467468.1 ABC transporter ATP-binding protein [Actinomadura alba]